MRISHALLDEAPQREGLEGGRFDAPPWVIAGLAFLLASAALGFVALRWMRSRKTEPRGSSLS